MAAWKRLLCLLSTGLILCATQASAQATRTWVSGVGNDANPCSQTEPCRTFAGAIANTEAGGEIHVLDPAAYGQVAITKSITIDGGPGAGGILVFSGNGITINAAATDTVTIRNLNFQGLSSGSSGIRIQACGTVNIEKCVILNAAQKGILAEPTNGCRLVVSDTTIRGSRNGANGGGVLLKPATGGRIVATFNRIQLDRNTFGLRAEDNTMTAIHDSSLSLNDTHGVVAVSSTAFVSLDKCLLSQNSSSGLRATVGGTIRFSDCTIMNNTIGLDSLAGNLVSLTNNVITGNGTDGAPTATTPLQ